MVGETEYLPNSQVDQVFLQPSTLSLLALKRLPVPMR